MKEILELANQVGEAIKNDERFKNYQELKDLQMADAELQEMISEFNLKRMNFTNESQSENADKEKVENLQKEVDVVYNKIMASETMQKLDAAANEFETLINAVFSTINFHITGEEQKSEGCSESDCAGCHGGCH